MTVSFEVLGRPVPKGSMRAFRHRTTGRVVVTTAARGLVHWEALVRSAAFLAMAGRRPMTGPLLVALRFALRPPRQRVREEPCVRPDLDKLVRALADSLTGVVYRDDSQVCNLTASKQYGLPAGARVVVSSLVR